MNSLRVEKSYKLVGTELSIEYAPYESGLDRFIHPNKGDFIGRDALLNKDKRPCIFGITCKTETPVSGSKVFEDDKLVGHITAGVPSPTLQIGIGYVRFYKPNDWPGRKLIIKLPNGSSHEGDIVELPFFDREKNIVRGIDKKIPSIPK